MKPRTMLCENIEEVIDRLAGLQEEEEVLIGVVDENKTRLGWLFPRTRTRIFISIEKVRKEAEDKPNGFLVQDFIAAIDSEEKRHELAKILYEVYETSTPTARPGELTRRNIDEIVRELKRRIVVISNKEDPDRDLLGGDEESPLGFESLVYENMLSWIEGRTPKYTWLNKR